MTSDESTESFLAMSDCWRPSSCSWEAFCSVGGVDCNPFSCGMYFWVLRMFGLVFKISYKDWEALLHARDASAATLFSGEGATGWSARPNYHIAWGCAHGARCLEPTQKHLRWLSSAVWLWQSSFPHLDLLQLAHSPHLRCIRWGRNYQRRSGRWGLHKNEKNKKKLGPPNQCWYPRGHHWRDGSVAVGT